jgi:hypothetical protein
MDDPGPWYRSLLRSPARNSSATTRDQQSDYHIRGQVTFKNWRTLMACPGTQHDESA